jgi:hypothetical protein
MYKESTCPSKLTPFAKELVPTSCFCLASKFFYKALHCKFKYCHALVCWLIMLLLKNFVINPAYHQVLIVWYGQLYQNFNFDQNQFIGFWAHCTVTIQLTGFKSPICMKPVSCWKAEYLFSRISNVICFRLSGHTVKQDKHIPLFAPISLEDILGLQSQLPLFDFWCWC